MALPQVKIKNDGPPPGKKSQRQKRRKNFFLIFPPEFIFFTAFCPYIPVIVMNLWQPSWKGENSSNTIVVVRGPSA